MKPADLFNKKAPKIKGIDFSDSKFTVVYFYPKDNTPGCTIEAKEFTERISEFKRLKTRVFGISKDSSASHERFSEKQGLKIDLLPDEEHLVQDKYGVWQMKKFMGREFMGTVRTTFLINSEGNVIFVWENVKAKGHAQSVLEYIRQNF